MFYVMCINAAFSGNHSVFSSGSVTVIHVPGFVMLRVLECTRPHLSLASLMDEW